MEPVATPSLRPPSPEQEAIIAAFQDSNIAVDAVAGSGKTTTILNLALRYPERQFLVLTYNSKLRLESRARADSAGIENATIHTYHSFGVRYIGKTCCTDKGIIAFLKSKKKKLKSLPEYDSLIIDEIQDMTPLLYHLVQQIILQCDIKRICVFGDRYQTLYEYAGADPRYLINADEIFGFDNWQKLSLSISYRLTRQNAAFVNMCLGEERIIAIKDGPRPEYKICNIFSPNKIADRIVELTESGYKPNNILILAPSVKRSIKPGKIESPIIGLANELSINRGIPVYIPGSDDKKLEGKVLENKIIFSTYHQAKGLEAKCIILMGFDSSYFQFYERDLPADKCCNTLYVAATRVVEILQIYQSDNKSPHNFLDINEIPKVCNLSGISKASKIRNMTKSNITWVTELTRHLSSEVLDECINLLKFTSNEYSDIINIATTSDQIMRGIPIVEEVSDINGICLPAYYEFITKGKATAWPHHKGEIPNAIDALQMTASYMSGLDGAAYRLNQITKYEWLEDNMRDIAVDRLGKFIGEDDSEMEVTINMPFMGKILCGRIDIVANDRVIELKTCSELSPEAQLQIAIYAFMNESECRNLYKYQLFNLKTGELMELKPDYTALKEMMKILICNKFHAKSTEDKFIEATKGISTVSQCAECAMWQ